MTITARVNKFRTSSVSYVFIRNGGSTVEVGGIAMRTPNCLYDPWSLLGWEIHSEGTKLISPGLLTRKESRIGYVCDESGVTASFQRHLGTQAPLQAPGADGTLDEVVKAPLQVTLTARQAVDWRMKALAFPVLYLSDGGRTLEWGGYIRGNDTILTNGTGEPVYRIIGDMTEIANTATGKTGMGYICDVDSGQTVTIGREITILPPKPLPGDAPAAKNLPRTADLPDPEPVNIVIRFCGAVGEICSFDRIPDIFDVGQSKRNFWMGMGVGLFVMFLIRLLV